MAALAAGSVADTARASDGLVGGIVGGVIGGMVSGAIQRDQQQRRAVTQQRTQPRATVQQRSTVAPATRVANQEMQASLNYFGFPAGTVDGVVGRNTRTAVSQFQAFMGYPVTGSLTEFERSFLVGSYHRAQAGGAMTHQMIAANPMGPRGLLLQYRDEMAGVGMAAAAPRMAPQMVPQAAPPQQVVVPQMPPATAPAAGAAAGVMAFAAPPAAAPAEEAPAQLAAQPSAPAAQSAPALPNFLGAAPEASASLASHCNRVSLQTNSNGGFTRLANLSDPVFALEEQFCLARIYAISDGEELAARVPGQTPAMIAEQCAGLGAVLQAQVAALGAAPAPVLLQEVAALAAGTGMAPQQLVATARICLSSGYRTDEMGVAIGAALLLAGHGERVYAELLGHHLALGFGAPERPDLALVWYDMAVAAMDAGARTPFLPGQPERIELIRAASGALGGRADLTRPGQDLPTQAALPSFGLPQKD